MNCINTGGKIIRLELFFEQLKCIDVFHFFLKISESCLVFLNLNYKNLETISIKDILLGLKIRSNNIGLVKVLELLNIRKRKTQ